MKETLKSFSLTIVDLFGIIIPGIVWFSMLILLHIILFNSPSPISDSPFIFFEKTILLLNENETISWIMFLILGMFTGYIIKPFSMQFSEYFSLPLSINKRIKLKGFTDTKYRFPYPAIFEQKEYFKIIKRIVNDAIESDYAILPGHSPYSYCKRYLKSVAPELWEENEHLEAETRMIGNLFLASVFNLLLSILGLIMWQPASSFFIQWLIISFVFNIILGIGFRRRRRKEVEYTYLLTIVADAKLRINQKTAQHLKQNKN